MHGEIDKEELRRQAHERLNMSVCYMCYRTRKNEDLISVQVPEDTMNIIRRIMKNLKINVRDPNRIVVCKDEADCEKRVQEIYEQSKL